MAEVNIGAWGRGMFVPASGPVGEDGDMVPFDSTSWGGPTRIGMTLSGTSDNVGFRADVRADGGAGNPFENNDNQYIWVSPLAGLKIYAGPAIFEDSLRGNSAYGSWNWLRPAGITGEDNVFDRANAGTAGNDSSGPTAVAGAIVAYHANGIHLNLAWDIDEDGNIVTQAVEASNGEDGVAGTADDVEAADAVTETQTTALMFQRGQYQVGYDIGGIGTIRAQYIGMYYAASEDDDAATNWGLINAAMKVDKLMPALYADLGVWIPTDSNQAKKEERGAGDAGGRTNQGMGVSAYVKYAMAPMTIHLSGDVDMGIEDPEEEEGMGMAAGVGFQMDLGGGLGIDSDVRYSNAAANGLSTKDKDGNVDKGVDNISFLLGVTQGYSNGLIGVGFQGATGTLAGKPGAENTDDFEWAVPVRLEYWF
jgi:hypothetical protein